jgi:5-methylcytosine-specific restriction endonuclease McrA
MLSENGPLMEAALNPSILSQPALVLNRSWAAISTITVQHALKLLFTGSARAVHIDSYEVHGFETWADLAVRPDEPCIRTVSLQIKVPEVVVLTSYNGMPTQSVVFTRRNLYKRDRNMCQYCGRRPGTSELSIDHVLPRSRGGKSTWANCVLACMRCNRKKGSRLPEEAGLHLLKKPVPPRWSPTLEIPLGRVKQSWERFVSERYWNVTLEP